MGQLEIHGKQAYVFASETCAFGLLDAVYINDVQPGEMVIVGPEGVSRERWAPEAPRSQCVFEHVYFSRPDSIVFGRGVQDSREEMGRTLAREAPAVADIVVPVPDSGNAAALGYAFESGLLPRFTVRPPSAIHYVVAGLSYRILAEKAIRDFSASSSNSTFHLQPASLEGK